MEKYRSFIDLRPHTAFILKTLVSVCSILFSTVHAFSQENSFQGLVLDAANHAPVPNATITIKVSGQSAPLAFAASDPQGIYRLAYKPGLAAGALLIVRCLGYKADTVVLTAAIIAQQASPFTHRLAHLSEELPEVGVTKPISFHGDTTNYRADAFTRLEDRTLEDVLKRLPGFKVENDGSIKYKDKPIRKILLDGDDLTGDGYREVSQSLHPALLKEIQAIEHYVENPLLHGLMESDDVVVNLTFKRPAFAFGNGTLEAGVPEKYRGNLSLLSFAPFMKSYLVLNANNEGLPYENMPKSPLNSTSLPAIPPAVQRFVSNPPAFGNDFALNHSLRGGLNGLFKVADNLKVRANASMVRNQLRNEQSSNGRYFLDDETRIVSENEAHDLNRPVFAELYGDYLGNNKRLTVKMNYLTQQRDFHASGYSAVDQFVSDSTAEGLANDGHGLYTELQFTRRIDSMTAFLLNGKMDVQALGQLYSVYSPLYEAVPAFGGATHLNQDIAYQQYNHQVFATFLKRKGMRYVSAIAGHEYHRSTGLSSLRPGTEPGPGAALFANDNRNTVQNLYLTGRYGYNDRKNEYFVSLTARQYWTRIRARDSAFLLLQPLVGFKLGLGSFSSLMGSYRYQHQQIANEAYYQQPMLVGVRSFQSGLDGYFNYGVHQASLQYAYNDLFYSQWQISASADFSHSRRGLIRENLFEDNLFYSRNIPHQGATHWGASGSAKKSVAALRSIVELKASFSSNGYYANNTGTIEKYDSFGRQLGFLFHTGFPIPVNFNVELQREKQVTKMRGNRIAEYETYNAFLLTKYRISKTINNETTSHFYRLSGSSYFLLDNETIYRPLNSKWTFSLKGKNLLDKTRLESRSISDLAETIYQSAIRGRYVVLSAALLIQ